LNYDRTGQNCKLLIFGIASNEGMASALMSGDCRAVEKKLLFEDSSFAQIVV